MFESFFGRSPERTPGFSESVESLDKLKAKIVLDFFRHDEKESDKTKSDEEIRLTPKGKEHVVSLSDENTDVSQAMAFGSPRKRTQETAGLMMAGGQDEITGEETAEELKEKLNADLKYGSKLRVDPRLNFVLPEGGEYVDEAMKVFKEGKLLKWLVEESDEKYKKSGLEGNYMSYKNQSKQVAEILAKYVNILPRWKSLVEDKTGKKTDYKPVMERFLGTHQTVSECFLAKVLELTKGVEERDRFVAALGGGGFGYSEGYKIEIEEGDNGEPKIHIKYDREGDTPEKTFSFDDYIDTDTLEKILNQD